MKYLIDENIGHAVIQFIKSRYDDSIVVKEELTGRDDDVIIKKAFEEKRIIITNDKDFGYLCFMGNYPTAGVILFRLREENRDKKIKLLDIVLSTHKDKIYNYFIVISDNKIRLRKLKKA